MSKETFIFTAKTRSPNFSSLSNQDELTKIVTSENDQFEIFYTKFFSGPRTKNLFVNKRNESWEEYSRKNLISFIYAQVLFKSVKSKMNKKEGSCLFLRR